MSNVPTVTNTAQPERVGFPLAIVSFLDAADRVASGGTVLDPDVVAQFLVRRRRDGPLREMTARQRTASQGPRRPGVSARLRTVGSPASGAVAETGLRIGRVPPDASKTRATLLDTAARAFARDGVFNASLIDITRQAGQRNRAALRYHFGSRDGILCAIIDRHAQFLARREGELLEIAVRESTDDLEPVVEALVRPAAELAENDWRGRCCLLVIAELTGEDREHYSPELQEVLARTGGNDVFATLTERTPFLTDPLRTERFSLMVMFILRAIADRARVLERRGRPGRAQLDHEPFVRNLVAMAAAAMAAPAHR